MFLLEVREKGVEQALEGFRFDEQCTEVAKGLTIWHSVLRIEAKEGAKAIVVGDLKARGFIGQTVEAL